MADPCICFNHRPVHTAHVLNNWQNTLIQVFNVLSTLKTTGIVFIQVFKVPNPWTMAMMNVLAELHQEQELKLNLKFEIEVLCKTLGLDVNELKPTTYLKDPTRMPSIEHQVCSAPHPDCWIGTLRVFLLDFSCPRSVFNGSQKKLHVPTSFFNSFCFFIFCASIWCQIHSLLLYYKCIVFFISAGSLMSNILPLFCSISAFSTSTKGGSFATRWHSSSHTATSKPLYAFLYKPGNYFMRRQWVHNKYMVLFSISYSWLLPIKITDTIKMHFCCKYIVWFLVSTVLSINF